MRLWTGRGAVWERGGVSAHNVLLSVVLPPLGLGLLALALALLAWRGRRWAGLAAGLALLLQLALATPIASGWLEVSLLRLLPRLSPPLAVEPRAIIVLSAEVARTDAGWTVGALTVERMAAAASLARRTGLPILVTGGPAAPSPSPPLAALMAERFGSDFGLAVRWVEAEAGNTWENARLSAALLRREGLGTAYVVSHGWHLPRALLSFRGSGLVAVPWPVRESPPPEWRAAAFVPRADRWALSWFALREWAGLGVYAVRLRLGRG